MTINLLSFLSVALSTTGIYFLALYLARRQSRMPPGPRRLPFIGNLLDMPSSYDWFHWAKHKSTYGPISSVTVFGQNYIIVNSQDVAVDLLERRSGVYVDRPQLPFRDMCGWANITTFLQPNDELVYHRRNMHRYIGSKSAVRSHQGAQEKETIRFLARLLNSPEDLKHHIEFWAAALILKVAYGYSVDTRGKDPLIQLIEESLVYLMLSAQTGTWFVDNIPLLKYLPRWMLGMRTKSFVQQSCKLAAQLADKPFRFVKSEMDHGTEKASFLSFVIAQDPTPNAEWQKWAAITLFAGGSDTSLAAVYAFFLAMTLYPEVQSKAQEEIDSVVGHDRLPNFMDRPKLPFVEAIIKEVIRWHSVIPMNAGHVSVRDDTYNGHYIPKGSIILVNLWFIMHDPDNFVQPFEFKPERFLNPKSVLDPLDVSFGYGRRACPGKYFVEASLFGIISGCLATLNIRKAVDKGGREIEAKHETTNSFGSHPKPFACSITARSSKAKDLILEANDDDEAMSTDAEILNSLSYK